MIPTEIAASLTPAQVRHLRLVRDLAAKGPVGLLPTRGSLRLADHAPTPLGIAVLAELERMGK